SNTHVVILDAASGRTLSNRWKGQHSGGTGGAWSPNGKLFAAGGNVIQVFDAISYKLVAKLAGQRSATSDLHFHPNGSRLASVGKDGNLIIWDAATGDMMLKIPVRNDSGLLEVEWSPDGRRIAVTTTGGELWIWGSPQMPKIPSEIDYLEDGVLKSVKTAEEQLAELSQRIEENPDDFSLLKERIEELAKNAALA
ncbi:MAG: WD40 repeat domain-containing protein, partial [bacterium]|nr:WD40 repeat domain-containing protein [bacterium]